MTREEWRKESLPVGVRMIEIRDKAEDQGLTEAERVELEALEQQWSQMLRAWLAYEFPREKV